MGLADFFRPKWKHSDVSVRSAAVKQLDEEELNNLVEVVKNDRDEGVRRLAIKKITDAEALNQLAKNDLDGSLRQLATDRAAFLWVSVAIQDGDEKECTQALQKLDDQEALAEVAKRAQIASISIAALNRLTDPRMLAEVARNTKSPELRDEALSQITDSAVLRGLAIDETRKEVASAILDRLDDRESLEAIAQRGKNKSVRTRAKRKLATLKVDVREDAEGLQRKQQHAKLIQLCHEVEEWAAAKDMNAAAPKIDAAKAEWQNLIGDFANPDEIQSRFDAACSRFDARQKRVEEKHSEFASAEKAIADERNKRSALCQQLDNLPTADAEAIQRISDEWNTLGDVNDHCRDLHRRFANSLDDVNSREEEEEEEEFVEEVIDPTPQLEALVENFQNILDEGDVSNAGRRLGGLRKDWSRLCRGFTPDEALSERFNGLQQRLEEHLEEDRLLEERQRADNLSLLEAICRRLEETAKTDDLKAAERLLREARNTFNSPGALPTKDAWEEIRNRYKMARELLFDRVQELKEADEWQRWSNVPKLEALCDRVDALLKVEDLKVVAEELRKAQTEWKKIGPVSREKSESLWKRFKASCDKAYEKCQEYFQQLEGERDTNLKQKETLCERVEALADSTDWANTAEEIKALQNDWKAVGPVPRKQSDAVWKRFRAACDKFFDQRKVHLDQLKGERTENLTKKEELCVQVEAFADSSEWDETANKIKGIQAQWKGIGPVPRKNSDALWKRFRGACDKFFDRRKDHLDEGKSASLKEKREVIAALAALAQNDEETDLVGKTIEYWKKFNELGPVPPNSRAELHRDRDQALSDLLSAQSEKFAGTELDLSKNLPRRRTLCERADELLRSIPQGDVVYLEETDVDDEGVEDMVAKLREAMASNTFKQEADESTKIRVEMEFEEIRRAWFDIAPTPNEEGKELQERFEKASDQLKALLGTQKPEQKSRGRQRRGSRRTRRPRSHTGPNAKASTSDRGQTRAKDDSGEAGRQSDASESKGEAIASSDSAPSDSAPSVDAPRANDPQ
jgi:hypothetical protein